MAAAGRVGANLQNPQILLQQLEGEFQDILAKEVGDNRWFELDADNHLVLRDRPLDCLALIWEFLIRLFTSKLSRIEHKFVAITERVSEYLKVEDDILRLGDFLSRHTLVINELYQSAAKMQYVGHITLRALQNMKQKQEIADLILTELDERPIAQGLRPAYVFRGIATIENQYPQDSKNLVRFCFQNEEEPLEATLSGPELAPHQFFSQSFENSGRSNSVQADVTHSAQLAQARIALSEVSIMQNGEIQLKLLTTQGVPPNHLHFKNESNIEMLVTLRPARAPFNAFSSFRLNPEESLTYSLTGILNNQDLGIQTTFRTPPKNFTPSCKLAKYRIEVCDNGALQIGILPQRVGETVRRVLKEGDAFTMESSNPVGCELVTFQIEGMRPQRALIEGNIKWKTTFAEQFSKLSRAFGHDPERLAQIRRDGIQIETKRELVAKAL